VEGSSLSNGLNYFVFVILFAELNAGFLDGRAFNLTGFKSVTLDGLWIAGFQRYDDGMRGL